MKTFLVSVNANGASGPSSRPRPEDLKPPNGVQYRTEECELTDRLPDSMPRLTRIARPTSRVQIEPDRPNSLSLAMRIASASSSNGTTATTGPKISSCSTRSAGSVGVEDGRREPEAGAVRRAAAEGDLVVVGHVGGDAVALVGADQRPHLGLLVGGVGDDDAAHRRLEQLHEPVVGAALDEDPRAGAAVLAGVVEDRVRRGGRGLLEVGVGEDDVGALAAEFEGHRLDAAPRSRP